MVIFALLYLQPQSHPYRVSINCAVFLHKYRYTQWWYFTSVENYRYLSHALHDAELLCWDETLQHDTYRHVNIVFVDVVAQVHASVSLRHANHRLNMTHGYWNTASRLQSSTSQPRLCSCVQNNKISPMWDWQSTASQVLSSSKSRDTKN